MPSGGKGSHLIGGGNGSSGNSSAFTDLTDTPGSYDRQAGKILVVNTAEDALEYKSAPRGDGTTERITARRITTLAISSKNAESTIAFDPDASSGHGLAVSTNGNIGCSADGLYHSNLVLYVSESSNQVHYGWIEIKPVSTRTISGLSVTGGTWNIYPYSLFCIKVVNDSSVVVSAFNIDLLAMDELRFKVSVESGTSTLKNKTIDSPSLGKNSQVAARLDMFRVGPVA